MYELWELLEVCKQTAKKTKNKGFLYYTDTILYSSTIFFLNVCIGLYIKYNRPFEYCHSCAMCWFTMAGINTL